MGKPRFIIKDWSCPSQVFFHVLGTESWHEHERDAFIKEHVEKIFGYSDEKEITFQFVKAQYVVGDRLGNKKPIPLYDTGKPPVNPFPHQPPDPRHAGIGSSPYYQEDRDAEDTFQDQLSREEA